LIGQSFLSLERQLGYRTILYERANRLGIQEEGRKEEGREKIEG